MEDLPLPALSEQAWKMHQSATESGYDQEAAKKGCEVLEKCEDMISKLGLFSANETKEDISTTNLNYLLILGQKKMSLPTISIEEAGLMEMEMMNKWQKGNAKLMEEANSAWHKDTGSLGPKEEDDEDDDAAVEKSRAWDDWKDDNPRGAGNKKLTPCGERWQVVSRLVM